MNAALRSHSVADPTCALQIRGLRKHFETFTLDGIDLDVPRGYVVGLVGANGSGKTTTIGAAIGTVVPDEGHIAMPPMDRVGVVLDTPYFLHSWTPPAIEKAVRPFYPAWSGDRYRSLLTRLGVPTDTRLTDMSRGTGMKLQMAVALAHEPTLLVLDEPTSGLDPLARDEFIDLVAEFMQEESRAVLFSTHITSDLERIADYVAVLDRGRLLTSAPTPGPARRLPTRARRPRRPHRRDARVDLRAARTRSRFRGSGARARGRWLEGRPRARTADARSDRRRHRQRQTVMSARLVDAGCPDRAGPGGVGAALRLDLTALDPRTIWTAAALVPVGALATVAFDAAGILIGLVGMWALQSVLAPWRVDETDNGARLRSIVGLSRRTVVAARYVWTGLLLTTIAVVFTLAIWGVGALLDRPVSEYLATLWIGSGAILFVLAAGVPARIRYSDAIVVMLAAGCCSWP